MVCWLRGTTIYEFDDVDDEFFNELLLRMTVVVANKRYNNDFFNTDNVYEYIEFKDKCFSNLHKESLLLVKAS